MTGRLRQFLAAVISVAIAFPLGAASSGYDPVGNRLQETSTLPSYPGGLTNYNPSAALRAGANDQLSTDTYDANIWLFEIPMRHCESL